MEAIPFQRFHFADELRESKNQQLRGSLAAFPFTLTSALPAQLSGVMGGEAQKGAA